MRVGTRISAVFLVSLVVAGTLAGLSWVGASSSAKTQEWVNQTNEVLKKLEAVSEDLFAVQNGARGYVITGEPSFLEPYEEGRVQTDLHLAELKKLLGDNPRQLELAGVLADLARQRLEYSQKTIELRRARGAAAAAALVATGQGEAVMKRMRAILTTMRQAENQLLGERLALTQRRARQALEFILASVGTMTLLMLLGVLWLTHSITRPLAQLVRAARQFGRGEQPAAPEVRDDEIGDLAREFMEMAWRRQKAEDERQVFVSLIENSSDFIGIADPTGKPIYVNPAGRRMVGLAADASVEETQIADYYPPEERQFALDVIFKAMVEQGRFSGETWFRNFETGEAIPVSDEHFLIKDPKSGRVLGMGTITRDIREQRRLLASEREANERMRESEERFRGLVDAAAQIVWTTDANGEVVEDSPSLRAFTGSTWEQLKGHGWLDLLHPDDRERSAAVWKSALERKTPIDIEHRVRHASGEWRWTAVRAVPLLRPDGTVRTWVGMNADVTARKRAEEALKALEAKSSGILAVSADALISVDENQRITMFNEGAEKIFGYSRAEALGAPLDLLIPEQVRARHRQHVDKFAAGETVARRMGERGLVITGVRKNGEQFPADAAISRLDVGGKRILTVALRDITEQRRLENELRRALRSRDDVLGIVAHDLRNPLSTIIMQASMIKHQEPDTARQRPAESIARAAKRMNRLIQDLLDVAQVEMGELRVQRARMGAGALLGEAVDTQRSLAASAQLSLEVEMPAELPELWADRDRLLQVFENLIGNALKFTQAGGQITVGAVAREGDVLFSVADTGCGIAPESLPHVFDRFWQAAEHTGRLGAGLGLPITKGIVEAHGGRIWVESTLGQGTTFFFVIPTAGAVTESAGAPQY